MPVIVEYCEGGVSNVRILGRVKTIRIDWDLSEEEDCEDEIREVMADLKVELLKARKNSDREILSYYIAKVEKDLLGEGWSE